MSNDIEKFDFTEVEVVDTKEESKKEESKKDHDGYEKICSLCHRTESVAGPMIDLPNNMCVCNDCMQKSFDMMTNGTIDLSQLMNTPGIQFLNLSDMENMMPKQQKVKKKKEGEERVPLVDIKHLPAPH